MGFAALLPGSRGPRAGGLSAGPGTSELSLPASVAEGHGFRLIRAAVLLAAVAIGFHQTILSALQETLDGNPIAYLFLRPLCGATVAGGTFLRRRAELRIHDRQLDWILAGGLAGAIAVLNLLLLPRLGTIEQLTRIDVLDLLLFIITGCTLLFGSRVAGRYWSTWAYLLLSWPLPYRLAAAALGGSARSFALLNVALSALAVAISVGGGAGRRVRAGILTALVGAAVTVLFRDLPTAVFELAPGGIALLVTVPVVWHRAGMLRPGPAPIRRDAVPRAGVAMAALLLFATWLGFFVPLAPAPPPLGTLAAGGPGWVAAAVRPEGWRLGGTSEYGWVTSYFGGEALWKRYTFLPTGPDAAGGEVVVDALTVPEADSLSAYPTLSCYLLGAPSVQGGRPVALGDGVSATLYYASSAEASAPGAARWALLTWTWRVPDTGHGSVQRLSVITLDGSGSGSGSGIPVPDPPGAGGNVRSTFADILRGSPAAQSPAPRRAALDQLVGFARAVVALQGDRDAPATELGLVRRGRS